MSYLNIKESNSHDKNVWEIVKTFVSNEAQIHDVQEGLKRGKLKGKAKGEC